MSYFCWDTQDECWSLEVAASCTQTYIVQILLLHCVETGAREPDLRHVAALSLDSSNEHPAREVKWKAR